MDAIQVTNLTRTFGTFTAVNNISFNVPSGQVFGFLGPNGSGKTTTIRMLLGLLPPTAGNVQILGQDLRRAGNDLRSQIGYMSQKFSLYRDLTVMENLRFFGRGYGLSGTTLNRRIDAILEMAGLRDHRRTPTRDLSGGWAQRLALGAAILHEPRLIFLDEPTAGVDPVSRRAFWDLLYDLTQTGVTVFVTTHYMDEAEHCESVAFIYYGDIIAQGTPRTIIAETLPPHVLAFTPDDPVQALGRVRELRDQGRLDAATASLFGAEVHVTTGDPAATQTALTQAGLQLRGLYQTTPTLEEAFITLVERAENGKPA